MFFYSIRNGKIRTILKTNQSRSNNIPGQGKDPFGIGSIRFSEVYSKGYDPIAQHLAKGLFSCSFLVLLYIAFFENLGLGFWWLLTSLLCVFCSTFIGTPFAKIETCVAWVFRKSFFLLKLLKTC